ncbi:MAG TPA: hypothetical protein VMP03_03765 [Methylomirabilota bacterium]|nr:hypothetical protein [Methylomirabilota bacterium]
MLHTPAVSVASATRQVFTIEPDALEEALEADVLRTARAGMPPSA